MDRVTWRYLPMGEAALLVEGAPAEELSNRYVLALAERLDVLALAGVRSAVPAISSLLITFDPLAITHVWLRDQIQRQLESLAPAPVTPARIVTIAVTYGGDAGEDLDEVAQALGLEPAAVVALHCGPIYRVMMIGFAPGFPYIGPLPDQLAIPRRATPRRSVAAGAVAIAAGLTGIYPARLPGGWNLIGRTTLSLFDPLADSPALLRPGDGVQFLPLPDGVTP